jgi:hypothetical protein
MSNQKRLAIVFISILAFIVAMGIMGAAQEQQTTLLPTIAPPPVNSK